MRVALLKDPEMRERIERSGFVETDDPGSHEANDLGAARPTGEPEPPQ
jgi:hypothetical protein